MKQAERRHRQLQLWHTYVQVPEGGQVHCNTECVVGCNRRHHHHHHRHHHRHHREHEQLYQHHNHQHNHRYHHHHFIIVIVIIIFVIIIIITTTIISIMFNRARLNPVYIQATVYARIHSNTRSSVYCDHHRHQGKKATQCYSYG